MTAALSLASDSGEAVLPTVFLIWCVRTVAVREAVSHPHWYLGDYNLKCQFKYISNDTLCYCALSFSVLKRPWGAVLVSADVSSPIWSIYMSPKRFQVFYGTIWLCMFTAISACNVELAAPMGWWRVAGDGAYGTARLSSWSILGDEWRVFF